MTQIKAVVFDAYGTLFDVNSALEKVWAADPTLALKLGARKDALNALWRQKQIEYSFQVSLRGDYIDFWQITQRALAYALKSFNLDDNTDNLSERLLAAYLRLEAYPDACHCLSTLRDKGLSTHILSNGSPAMLEAACDAAGISAQIDKLISIDPIKLYKPHPKTYQSAVDCIGLPCETLLFVSSNNWDIAGAAYFGLKTLWIKRSPTAQAEVLEGTPLGTISDLGHLPDYISGQKFAKYDC